jgi:glycosyltransferase involved in cell wall biosynthesis
LTEASVIVCVRNGAATIGDQLAALSRQETSHTWEVVIVDNGCTDHTTQIVEQWRPRLSRLRVVPATERTGLAYARNVGAAAAEGQVLAFCDADDIADSGWLDALVAGTCHADLVGGQLELELLNDEVTRYWRGMSVEDTCRASAMGYLNYAVGANFAVRRATFEAVGGCDERFAVCGDDIDLSWRIQERGGSLVFREDAVMHYRLRADLRGLARQRFRYGQMDALLRRKFRPRVPPVRWTERWPTYRYLMTRSWHLLMDPKRRGGWIASASYCAGRIAGSFKYGTLSY